jgi:nucleoid DNA-binding protein
VKATFRNLVAATAESARLPKKATERALKCFFRHLAEAVWAQGAVIVPGLAGFRVGTRKARRINNPVTREPMQLPQQRIVAARVVASWRRRG